MPAATAEPALPAAPPNQAVDGGGRVHDLVVRTLGAWVLGGRYAPGEVLPRESDLAASLRVSRTSVREAIKVLGAKGLLEARPRVGLKVRPRDACACSTRPCSPGTPICAGTRPWSRA